MKNKALETSADAPPANERRQAVIVIHGMGQQRPMQTLRSMVHALWETDLSLTEVEAEKDNRKNWKNVRTTEAMDGIGAPQPINKSWIVPDTRTGSKELARITTSKSDAGVRTDFYELYWADIMEGTTVDHLKSWITGLLLRWPHQVPSDVKLAFYLLWVLTLAGLGFALHGMISVFLDTGVAPSGASPALQRFWQYGIVAVGAVVGVYLLLRLKKNYPHYQNTENRLFGWLLPIAVSVLLALIVPASVLLQGGFWSLVASAGIGALIHMVLVPYFGDVARYVRAEPDTVAKRAAVMDRGLELLRRLHGPVPSADISVRDYDLHKQPRSYERIVVVAHSLGSVIAYDLLRHFWAERGPIGGGIVGDGARKAMRDLDTWLTAQTPQTESGADFDIETYREKQRAVSTELAQEDGGWLVSDFVTLGSPLTHAEFLLAHDRPAFERAKRDGLVPTSPPTQDSTSNSFLYEPKTKDGKKEAICAQHTAMFAAMRWSNVYDRSRLVLLGDIVSGPLTENFGRGIADFDVSLLKDGNEGLLGRFFTHTHYWSMAALGRLQSSNKSADAAGIKGDQDHIEILRRAVALNDVGTKIGKTDEMFV